jgi:hypothetical protein
LDYAVLEAKARNVDVVTVLREEIEASRKIARLNISEQMLEAAARRSNPPPDSLDNDEMRPF